MACAALMDQQIQPMYFPLLDTPSTPGVRNLQILIERAWRDGKLHSAALTFYSLLHIGYDQEGAEDMRRDLVDSNKWIGTAGMCPLCFLSLTSLDHTTELYVAFTYKGIP